MKNENEMAYIMIMTLHKLETALKYFSGNRVYSYGIYHVMILGDKP